MIQIFSSLMSTTREPGSTDSRENWPTSTQRWTSSREESRHYKREATYLNCELSNKDFDFSVNTKFVDNGRGLTVEEAKAVRAELLSIQQSLSTGEQEKIELMKSLACLKDDLTRLQPSESSLDVSVAHEKFSTASQTDLSGEVILL